MRLYYIFNIIASEASEKSADLHNPPTFNNNYSFCNLEMGAGPSLKP